MSAIGLSFIWEFTKRDFSERFAGSMLGAVWALIWPIVNLLIYIIIFGKLMGARLPGNSDTYAYSIYLISGLIPWIAFTNTIGRASTIFLEKKTLITKVSLRLPSLVIFVGAAEAVTLAVTYAFFFIFLVVTEYPLNRHMLLVPLIFYLQQVLALSLGLLFATLTTFFRDLKEVVGITLQLWFWATPIIYVQDILPNFIKRLLVLNPAVYFIDAYHDIFMYAKLPSLGAMVFLVVMAHGVAAFAYWVFRSLEKDVRDAI